MWRQKLFLRTAFCPLLIKELKPGKKLSMEIYKKELGRGAGAEFKDLANKPGLLDSARSFRGNLNGRGAIGASWIPVKFQLRLVTSDLTVQESIQLRFFSNKLDRSKNMVSGKKCISPDSPDSIVRFLSPPHSSAILRTAEKKAKSVLRETMASAIGPGESEVLKEFDRLCEKKVMPSVVSYVVYKKGKHHGMALHTDIYSAFGTVICVINETPEAKLKFEDPIAEYGIRDFIVFDPMMEHWVEAGKRREDRKSLVFNF